MSERKQQGGSPPEQTEREPHKVDENVQEEAAKERAENEGYE